MQHYKKHRKLISISYEFGYLTPGIYSVLCAHKKKFFYLSPKTCPKMFAIDESVIY